jgi:fructose-1,6-bisphosphatase/inositol monophosphatase family enzyme
MSRMIDREIVASLIRDTAHDLILPRFRALGSGDIREKKPGDLVTIADVETERELTRKLAGLVDGALILGEETVAEDPGRLDDLAKDVPVWIIDPVDGTANFAKGAPGFACIVALTRRGAVEAGWIYDPLGDLMVSAIKGEGAWLGAERLRVAAEVPPERITGSAYGRAKSGLRAAKALNESGRIRGVHNQGCSGLEYMSLSRGLSQFSLHSRSLPWDHAAGMLIVAEAGGRASFLDGSVYDARIVDRPVLSAASSAAWQTVHDIMEHA